MHEVVVLVDGVGDGGQVDDGVAPLESFEERVVVVGRVGGAHLRVGRRGVRIFMGAVDLDSGVALVGAQLDNFLAHGAAGSGDGDLHGGGEEAGGNEHKIGLMTVDWVVCG